MEAYQSFSLLSSLTTLPMSWVPDCPSYDPEDPDQVAAAHQLDLVLRKVPRGRRSAGPPRDRSELYPVPFPSSDIEELVTQSVEVIDISDPDPIIFQKATFDFATVDSAKMGLIIHLVSSAFTPFIRELSWEKVDDGFCVGSFTVVVVGRSTLDQIHDIFVNSSTYKMTIREYDDEDCTEPRGPMLF